MFRSMILQSMTLVFLIRSFTISEAKSINCINGRCLLKRAADTRKSVNNGNDQEFIDERKCNSEGLRNIMIKHMRGTIKDAKLGIMREAEHDIGGHFNVICARGDFSYLTTTRLYCLHSVGPLNCYAFLSEFRS